MCRFTRSAGCKRGRGGYVYPRDRPRDHRPADAAVAAAAPARTRTRAARPSRARARALPQNTYVEVTVSCGGGLEATCYTNSFYAEQRDLDEFVDIEMAVHRVLTRAGYPWKARAPRQSSQPTVPPPSRLTLRGPAPDLCSS